jgi:PhoH-like ATPase
LTKRFLLDTNVLLHDPKSIEVFADNEVIIPIPVLDELDHAKTRPDEVGRNARSVIRRLDELRTLGSLNAGVRLPSGSIIRVELNHRAVLPPTLSDSVDNRLIRTAMGLQQESPEVPIIVVTKDINLRVKCDALGIMAQDYEKDKLAKTPDALYAGFETVNVMSSVIDELYSQKIIDIDVSEKYPNKFILL